VSRTEAAETTFEALMGAILIFAAEPAEPAKAADPENPRAPAPAAPDKARRSAARERSCAEWVALPPTVCGRATAGAAVEWWAAWCPSACG
jgi:hypothetical protein